MLVSGPFTLGRVHANNPNLKQVVSLSQLEITM